MRRFVMLLILVAGGAAAAQAPAEQQAAPAPQVKPAAPAPKPEKPKAEKPPVTQSWGSGTIGLLLQGWFTASTDTRFSAAATSPTFKASGANNAGTSTFRLRRAEMSYDGAVAKIVKYRAMIDPTIIQNGPIAVSGDQGHETVTVKDILQDAWVGFQVPWHEVRLGQFKIPLTMEGFGSSGKLDFAERSIMSRTFGDQRDIGLMVLSDKIPYVEYEVALVNGAGKNLYDNSPQKTGVFRVVATPYKGISVGGSAQLGGVYSTSAGRMLHRNRAGVEASVEMYGASLKAEYMGGVDGQANSVNRPSGYYVTGGYRYQNWQGVVRYERYVSDNPTSTEECRATPNAGTNRCQKNHGVAVGVNYDLEVPHLNGAKLQLDYLNDKDEVQDTTAHEVFLVAQVKF